MNKTQRIEEIQQTIADIDNGTIYTEWENHDPDFLSNLTAAKLEAKTIRQLAAALVRAQLEIELSALNNHNSDIVEYLVEQEIRHLEGVLVTMTK